jgi:hypothetical protein
MFSSKIKEKIPRWLLEETPGNHLSWLGYLGSGGFSPQQQGQILQH